GRPEIHLEGTQPGQSEAVVRAVVESVGFAASASAAPADSTAGAAGAAKAAGLGARAPRLAPSVSYLHGGPSLDTLDYFGGAFVGVVVFFLVFVITCVAFLRERGQGTLERLLASPLRRGEVVVRLRGGVRLAA